MKTRYHIIYWGFLLSVSVLFLRTRSFSSPHNMVIAGDGFGYYSYLPAKYIYHDDSLRFRWFNKAYFDNYSLQKYEDPSANFLVKVNGKTVNKYNSGLSLLWAPFFHVAHFFAPRIGYAADGFSKPYQAAIGIASLFYLLLGLFYLRKLLISFGAGELAAFVIPVALFFGTWLYRYGIAINSLTHVYSFSLISMFLYYGKRYLSPEGNRKTMLSALFLFSLIVSVRPFNGVILLALIPLVNRDIPARITAVFKGRPDLKEWLFITSVIYVLFLHFSAVHRQSGSFFINTYGDERFYFDRPKLKEVLFSYHAGIFLYCPLFLLLLFSPAYKELRRYSLFCILFLLLISYFYSCWWYWPITTRAMIDFYPLAAIAMIPALSYGKMIFRGVFILASLLFIAWFQLKDYQLLSGILDGNLTYKELYIDHFFRTKKVNMYVIPPKTIIDSVSYADDFEQYPPVEGVIPYRGKCSPILNKTINFSKPFSYLMPELFKKEGVKKLRFSIMANFRKEADMVQVYLYLYDKDNKELGLFPYYINESVTRNEWDRKEFGYEFSDEEIRDGKIHHITWFLWNNALKEEIWIDDARTEFILTDRSYDIVK